MARSKLPITMHENYGLIPRLRFQVVHDFCYVALMASSDVDQKFLGRLARDAERDYPFLASMLFKVLGLSVLLSKRLVRARRLRRLDTTRDTKSLQLYHRIIWLSREGLRITEEYILPMTDDKYAELAVLGRKLRASFYHIFVLFHNQPSINQASIPSYRGQAPRHRGAYRAASDSPPGGPVQPPALPPGLAPISIPKPSGSFLLPAVDYIPIASTYFAETAALAERVLPGSHPLRASVKVEYAAYLYDCLHDGEGSRRLAKSSLHDVYTDEQGMDDDMFEDTAKLVVILDKMSRRGLSTAPVATSGDRESANTTPSTPRAPYATGAHPSLPSPGSRRRSPVNRQRSPETRRRSPESHKKSPDPKRSLESKHSRESKHSSGSKPSPESKHSPESKRDPARKRSPESKHGPEPKRGQAPKRGIFSWHSPEAKRPTSSRDGSEPKRRPSSRQSPEPKRIASSRYGDEPLQNASPRHGEEAERSTRSRQGDDSKRSSASRHSPEQRRGSSSRDTPEPKRSTESKRTPESKHSSDSKRTPESKRSSGSKRTPESKRIADAKRAAGPSGVNGSRLSPEKPRTTNDRRSATGDRAPSMNEHNPTELRNATDKQPSKERSSPSKRNCSKGRSNSGHGWGWKLNRIVRER